MCHAQGPAALEPPSLAPYVRATPPSPRHLAGHLLENQPTARDDAHDLGELILSSTHLSFSSLAYKRQSRAPLTPTQAQHGHRPPLPPELGLTAEFAPSTFLFPFW